MTDLPLRCPVTREPLTPATTDQLQAINNALAEGQLENVLKVDGVKIDGSLSAAWVNASQSHAFPDQDGIPVLVPDAAIAIG